MLSIELLKKFLFFWHFFLFLHLTLFVFLTLFPFFREYPSFFRHCRIVKSLQQKSLKKCEKILEWIEKRAFHEWKARFLVFLVRQKSRRVGRLYVVYVFMRLRLIIRVLFHSGITNAFYSLRNAIRRTEFHSIGVNT